MAEDKRTVEPGTSIEYVDPEGSVRSISVREGHAFPKNSQETEVLNSLGAPVSRSTSTRKASAKKTATAPVVTTETRGPGAPAAEDAKE